MCILYLYFILYDGVVIIRWLSLFNCRYEGSMYSYSHSPQNTGSSHSPSSSKFSSRSSGPGGGRNSSSSRRSTRMGGANRKHVSRKEPRSQSRRHTDLPPATDPFWGEFKVLLPTPDIPPVEGRDLELDYPPLSDELAEEYGLNHVQIFTLDTGNYSNGKLGRKGQDKDPHSESGNFAMKMEMHDSSYPEKVSFGSLNYIFAQSTLGSAQFPHILLNSPHILLNSPHILLNLPHMWLNSPHILFNSPHILFNSPHILFNSRHILFNSRHILFNLPHILLNLHTSHIAYFTSHIA